MHVQTVQNHKKEESDIAGEGTPSPWRLVLEASQGRRRTSEASPSGVLQFAFGNRIFIAAWMSNGWGSPAARRHRLEQ